MSLDSRRFDRGIVSLLPLLLLMIPAFLAFVGFLMAVWEISCDYIFPIFWQVAKGTVRGTVSLNDKLKPLANFWLLGISLAAIFVVTGIVYGSNCLGTSTASATAGTYCTLPLPLRPTEAQRWSPSQIDMDHIEHLPN